MYFDTLEMFKLVIGADEIEAEAQDTVTEYLTERAVEYSNRLGIQYKRVRDFDMVKDPLSDGYVLIFMCEDDYI
jgi:ribose 5-phosphate isomerase RpiB